MNIRESVNQNPVVAAVGLLAMTLIAGWGIVTQLRGNSSARVSQDYYTVDEGVTSFIDRANREPPFDHGGREAVRVHYFSCDGGKTRFVGWLEAYTPEAKYALDLAVHDVNGNLKDLSVLTNLGWDGKPMVKRPGDPRWFKRHEPQYDEITQPRCPDGADETQPTPIEVD